MATKLFTADDLPALPDDGMRHELVRGDLRTMFPAGARHGAINALIGALLFQYARARRLGILLTADTGFVLARDPDTVRCPDVAFLRRERISPDGPGTGFVEGAPDLAVEVLSPGDTALEIEAKVEEYLSAGCPLVWVVNPDLRRVTVHRPGAAPRIAGADEELDGGEVLPGFRYGVGELFEV